MTLILMSTLAGLSGCGQKGPLKLPPPAVAPSATAASAAAR